MKLMKINIQMFAEANDDGQIEEGGTVQETVNHELPKPEKQEEPKPKLNFGGTIQLEDTEENRKAHAAYTNLQKEYTSIKQKKNNNSTKQTNQTASVNQSEEQLLKSKVDFVYEESKNNKYNEIKNQDMKRLEEKYGEEYKVIEKELKEAVNKIGTTKEGSNIRDMIIQEGNLEKVFKNIHSNYQLDKRIQEKKDKPNNQEIIKNAQPQENLPNAMPKGGNVPPANQEEEKQPRNLREARKMVKDKKLNTGNKWQENQINSYWNKFK